MTEIPANWKIVKLEAVVQPRKNKDIPSLFPELPYIGMEHVVRDIGRIDTFGNSIEYRSSAHHVYEGDLLYGRLRPYLNKVAIAPSEAFASGEFIVLPPNEDISGKFLQFRLLSQDFVEFAGTLDTGDRPRVSWSQVSQFEIALPPIDEQHKIVEILEDHLSRLDAALADVKVTEKKIQQLLDSLLLKAFAAVSGDGLILKDIASVIDCEHKTAPKSQDETYAYSLGTSSVRRGVINFDKAKPISKSTFEEWTVRKRPRQGDLIFTREAPIGESAIIPAQPFCALGQRTVLISVDDQEVESEYLHLILMSPQVKKWMSEQAIGTTVLHLNVADVKKIPIGILPSFKDQRTIVEEFKASHSLLVSQTSMLQIVIERGSALRRSLLQAAFTGQLTNEVAGV
jgi:type I restriction enzyme S subunit